MATPNCVIGLDPGASGAIAICRDGDMQARKLEGLTEYDVRAILVENADDCHAYLEVVGPNRIAKEGERRQGASSMFSFGRSYGFLRGVLIGLAIPFDDVRPIAWQRLVGIASVQGETSTEKKRRHKAKAQQLFPQLKVTLATCDALLICEYGWRQYRIPQTLAESTAELSRGTDGAPEEFRSGTGERKL